MTVRTTSFTERMVGRVARLDRPRTVTLPERGPSCGDGVRAEAETMLADAAVDPRRTCDLDLRALRLVVDPTPDRHDGYRADIVGGRADGLGPGSDGPIVAGFADLLLRAGAGRRFSYRMLVDGGTTGEGRWRIVEGVKEVSGGAWGAWPETTTLFTRVLRPVAPDGVDGQSDDFGRDLAATLAEAIPSATVECCGVLRILPGDLVSQGRSMRGGVLPFLAGFLGRVLDRGVVR